MRALLLAAMAVFYGAGGVAQPISPLLARGYTVIPEPQKVSLGARDFTFDPNWQLKLDASVRTDEVAVETLREDLGTRFHMTLGAPTGSGGTLSLRIAPGSVQIGKASDDDKASLEEQAYRIQLSSQNIRIVANASTGLFYGVETLMQMLRPEMGRLWLPEGTIEDWPDLELRNIFWDDNHHLDRVDVLKRDLRQAAFYKINGFVIKLDGHFQYKSAPAVVEPYVLTPAELQDLTNYGLRYHVQLIPYLDGPAHVAFILKHPEYAKLREYPDNNYEMCAANPAAYKLLDGMYQDLLDANQGVKYFFVATDESYYLGVADNSQCNEAELTKQLGSRGQVYANFLDKTAGYLHDHGGRTVMFWGLDPLTPTDVSSLPPNLVNAWVHGPAFDEAFHQRGIKQVIITYVEGDENLFPDYSLLPPGERLHEPEGPRVEKVAYTMRKIAFDPSRVKSSVIGEISTRWGDTGANPETFWLGYIADGSAAWHPESTGPRELASTFYSLFYGPQAVNMGRVYQLMSEQAQSWTDSWDWMHSKARKPILGTDWGLYKTPEPADDQTLPLPPTPSGDLDYTSTWSKDNARRLALTFQAKEANDTLLDLLGENLRRSQFNRYNLEVYVTIADLYRQNEEMISGIHDMDVDLASASQLRDKDPKAALSKVDDALDSAGQIWQGRNEVLRNTIAIWDEDWFPRVADANGRHFLHELDDIKDHPADRTVDLSYLVYREKLLPFGDWVDSIVSARNQFATAHNLPTRNYRVQWNDLSAVSSRCSSADPEATCGWSPRLDLNE